MIEEDRSLAKAGFSFGLKPQIAVENRPQPKVRDPSDAVIKLSRTTICGTDLHIIHGNVPTVEKGRVLGHEGVGFVESVGKDVKNFKAGDHVLIACITSCATCSFCKKGEFGLCNTAGGWRLGHTNDGTQAEYVRILHADNSLHLVPEGVDERSLLVLSDILPTGLEVGVLRGGVKPGCSMAIIGAGPVGLATLLTAQLYSPSTILVIDKDEDRLKIAKKMGATHTLNPDKANGDLKTATKEHHGEIDGFDVVVEAVGVPATFLACQELVGKGGAIANVGVHGTKVDFNIDKLWGRAFVSLQRGGETRSAMLTEPEITMALVNTSNLPTLLKLFRAGKLHTEEMITHDFKFGEIFKAYDTFGKASETWSFEGEH